MMPGQRVLRDRLKVAIDTTMVIYGRLNTIKAEKSTVIGDGASHGKIDHSQPPWNAPVVNLMFDLHAWSRDTEATLRRVLNLSDLHRGGSDENTTWAVKSLSNLAESVEDPRVAELVSWLEGWSNRAQIILGERDSPRRLPRQPAEPEPFCPYCTCHTLRFWASRGVVRCVNPTCRDGEGLRPAAIMEYSVVALDWVLAWKDGTVGLPTASVLKREVA